MNSMYFAISRHTKGRKGTKRSDVLVLEVQVLGYHQYVISYVLPVHLIQKYIVIQHRRSLIFVTHKNLQVDMEYKDQHKPLFYDV